MGCRTACKSIASKTIELRLAIKIKIKFKFSNFTNLPQTLVQNSVQTLVQTFHEFNGTNGTVMVCSTALGSLQRAFSNDWRVRTGLPCRMSRVRIPSPAFRSGTEGFASRPSLGADSLPSLREVSAAVLRTATGIGTSLRSVRIPSPALVNHPRFEQKALRLQGVCVVCRSHDLQLLNALRRAESHHFAPQLWAI